MPMYVVRTGHGDLGPLDHVEVKQLAAQGKLEPNDMVRPVDGTDWRPARDVKGYVAPDESPSGRLPTPASGTPKSPLSGRLPAVLAAIACSIVTGVMVWAVMYLSNTSSLNPKMGSLQSDATIASGEEPAEPGSDADRIGYEAEPAVGVTSDLIESARRAAAAKNYEQAISLYRRLLDLDESRDDWRLELARVLLDAGSPGDALAKYRIVLENDFDNVEAWIGIGDAYLHAGTPERLADAATAWERARALAPDDESIVLKLLLVYELTNMSGELIRVAEDYVGDLLDSQHSDRPSMMQLAAMKALARAYSIEGRSLDAEAACRAVLRFDASNASARTGLAGKLLAREDYAAASQILDGVEDSDADVWFMRARIAVAEGDLASAASALRSSLEMNEAVGERWRFLAAIEYDRDHMQSALESIERAIALDGTNVDYLALRARALIEVDRAQEALQEASQVAAKGGDAGLVAELRGLALVRLDQPREAETALNEAMEARPTMQAGIALAALLQDREAWMESAAVYSQLETVQPDAERQLRQLRARMHVREGRAQYQSGGIDEAVRHQRTAVELHPSTENKKGLVNILSLKVLELLSDRDYAAAHRYNQEVARYDDSEAIKLSRLIRAGEDVQRRQNAPVPRVPVAPVPMPAGGVLESRIVSNFSGKVFDHGNLFELGNGQVWKQTEYYIYYHYAIQPRVFIYRDGVVWRMKVDGIDRPIAVKRLR